MNRVYISAPIAHYDLKEREQYFQEVEDRLKNKGYEVINPMKNGISQDEHWTVHMKRDIELLLRCDSIYMGIDWFKSKGCKLEFDVATSCGLEVIGYDSKE